MPPLDLLEKNFKLCGSSPSGLLWKEPSSRAVKAGAMVGQINNKGYWQTQITIEGKRYVLLVHRIVFFMYHKTNIDNFLIDHIDGNTTHNKIENLRIATRQENQWNRRSAKNSSSKYKGVSWHKRQKKWQAKIKINQREKFLGYFSSENDAAMAYEKAAKQIQKQFSLQEAR